VRAGAKLRAQRAIKLEQPLAAENYEASPFSERPEEHSSSSSSDDNYSSFQQTYAAAVSLADGQRKSVDITCLSHVVSFVSKMGPIDNVSGAGIYSDAYLRNFSAQVFMHFGVRKQTLYLLPMYAKSDLRGIDSHGIARLHTYFEMLELGRINPKPKIKIVREKASVATVDGDNGSGFGRGTQGQ
jgi:hypothetical protein